MSPEAVMWRQRSRLGAKSSDGPMRFALPGERPPSSRPAGMSDGVIEGLDKLASRMQQSGGRIN
jgi:hypothetical protein